MAIDRVEMRATEMMVEPVKGGRDCGEISVSEEGAPMVWRMGRPSWRVGSRYVLWMRTERESSFQCLQYDSLAAQAL